MFCSQPVSVPLSENTPVCPGAHPVSPEESTTGRSGTVGEHTQLLQQGVNTWVTPVVLSLTIATDHQAKENPRECF